MLYVLELEFMAVAGCTDLLSGQTQPLQPSPFCELQRRGLKTTARGFTGPAPLIRSNGRVIAIAWKKKCVFEDSILLAVLIVLQYKNHQQKCECASYYEAI